MLRLQMASYLLLFSLLHQSLDLCVSLESEGSALLRFKQSVEVDPYGCLSNWGEGNLNPCSWFGVECSDLGTVVSLNLKDLCLKGTLTPELGKFVDMKSLILSNNSFHGNIPREIGNLQKLQVLDLGNNDLSGPLPSDIGRILSLEILVLRGNSFINDINPELGELNMLSELVDEKPNSNRNIVPWNVKTATTRKLFQVRKENSRRSKHEWNHITPTPAPAPYQSPWIIRSRYLPMPPFTSSPVVPPSGAPSPTSSDEFIMTPETVPSPSIEPPTLVAKHQSRIDTITRISPSMPNNSFLKNPPSPVSAKRTKNSTSLVIYTSVGGGVTLLVALAGVYIFCCRVDKVVTIMPWATGLSGQLQKALVTGVPSLKRSELERACEGFSNIIGSLSDCMLYKGTLSSGIEIAVTSSMIMASKDWSDQCEAEFRKKVATLCRVNHKNFMNLIGYCEEEEPFTRILVFEYTPNGTLFEHLHIKEAEHLDWSTRLRIVMGIAYCLEHMHRLDTPVVIKNLNSSSIYLTDDYAAKLSDLVFTSDGFEAHPGDESPGLLDVGPESVVYKFGIILLEIISGRRPFSKDDGLLVLWASSYLTRKRPLTDMVDSTLESFREEDVAALCEVIRPCISPDPRARPTMGEVVGLLKKITVMSANAATPKISPLWWAELEVISTDES